MGGHHPQNLKAPLGKTLAGVISGAAANIRSKFSHLTVSAANDPQHQQTRLSGSGGRAANSAGSSPEHLRGQRQQQPQQVRRPTGGVGGGGTEQPASAIPITVPGAADISKHSSYSEC